MGSGPARPDMAIQLPHHLLGQLSGCTVDYRINTTNIHSLPPSRFFIYLFLFIYVDEVVGRSEVTEAELGGSLGYPLRMATSGCGTFGHDEKGELVLLGGIRIGSVLQEAGFSEWAGILWTSGAILR